jgi:2-keto-3-deoxy-L-rhamnonate aldolase RhmA
MAPPALTNTIREKLLRGEIAYTLSVKLVRSVELPMIAKSAGYDGILIDMEHSSFDLDTTGQICIAALYAGIAPIVRVPSKDPFFVSRVLDGGALGVIVPHIRTLQDVHDVVAAAKFQPAGHRSAVNGLPHFQFQSVGAKTANPILNQNTLVIPMIETLEALDIVEDIAAIDGVDSLLIGTNDLTAEMGIPGDYENDRLTQAYERTIRACRRVGKWTGVGGLHSRLDLVQKFCRMGADWVMAATDGPLLMSGAAKRAGEMAVLNNEVVAARRNDNETHKDSATQYPDAKSTLQVNGFGGLNGLHTEAMRTNGVHV